LCGFSTPTAMGQSFIMTLYNGYREGYRYLGDCARLDAIEFYFKMFKERFQKKAFVNNVSYLTIFIEIIFLARLQFKELKSRAFLLKETTYIIHFVPHSNEISITNFS
jgi:hypothetical protein